MTHYGVSPSEEVVDYALREVLLTGVDWRTSYCVNRADYGALDKPLAAEHDRHKFTSIAEERSALFVNCLGSLVLWANKEAVLAERTAFEEKFGES